MATKPITSYIHATDALFGAGPAFGFSTKLPVATPLQGFVPGIGIAAEQVNDLFNITGSWITAWLLLGSSLGAEDAHLVETDAVGLTLLAQLAVGPHTTAASPLTVVSSGGLRAFTCTALGGSGVDAALFSGDFFGSAIIANGGSGGHGVEAFASGNGDAVRASVFGGIGAAVRAIGDSGAVEPTVECDPGGVNPLRGPFRLVNSNAPSGAVVDGEFHKSAGLIGFGRGDYAVFDADGAQGGGGGGFQKMWTTTHGQHFQDEGDSSAGPTNSAANTDVEVLTLNPGAITPTRPETGSKTVAHWSCRLSQTAGAIGGDNIIVEVFDSVASAVIWSYRWEPIVGLGTTNGISVSGFKPITLGAGSVVLTLRFRLASGGGAETFTVDQARMYGLGNFE